MKALTLLGFLLLLSSPAAAEFRVGYGVWRYDIAGFVREGNRTYDFERDLEIEPSGRRSVALEWETGPGWWPDWAFSFASVAADGEHTGTFPIFDPILGVPVGTGTATIRAQADFDDYDLTARYPFTLGALRMAAGVTIKRLRGEVIIDDSNNPPPTRQDYDETVPELYAQFRLPLGKAFALAGAAQGLSYGGSSAFEWRAGAEFVKLAPLFVEIGWQEKRFDIDVDDYALDATLAGAVARAGFLFR